MSPYAHKYQVTLLDFHYTVGGKRQVVREYVHADKFQVVDGNVFFIATDGGIEHTIAVVPMPAIVMEWDGLPNSDQNEE